MRCWVSDFGGVNDKEREMERWRSAVASRLWMEVDGGVIVGVGLWMWVEDEMEVNGLWIRGDESLHSGSGEALHQGIEREREREREGLF